jgi:hypothetical protein
MPIPTDSGGVSLRPRRKVRPKKPTGVFGGLKPATAPIYRAQKQTHRKVHRAQKKLAPPPKPLTNRQTTQAISHGDRPERQHHRHLNPTQQAIAGRDRSYDRGPRFADVKRQGPDRTARVRHCCSTARRSTPGSATVCMASSVRAARSGRRSTARWCPRRSTCWARASVTMPPRSAQARAPAYSARSGRIRRRAPSLPPPHRTTST